MKVNFTKIIVFTLLFTTFSIAQISGKISEKHKELSGIEKEISHLEKKIETYSHKEKLTGKELENIEKQIFLYDKLISDLRTKIKSTSEEIKQLQNKSEYTRNRIKKIKKIFEQYAIWLYKNNEPSFWEMLLNPAKINDYLEMKYYFEYFTKDIERKVDSLNNYEKSLLSIKEKKLQKRKSLEKLIAEKEKRKKELLAARKRKNKLLAKLRKNKSETEKIIEQKRKKQKEISALISKLIEEEKIAEAKRKKEKTKKYEETKKENYFTGVKFRKLKGKLGWPVYGKIIKRFGKIRNPKLNTVSINNGIDIRTRSGAKVKAVADGIVSAVEWLPGFGPVVIISHGNKYRSVYGYVDEFKVTKGEKVKAGKVLGKVAHSLEGNVLHFEIWDGRKPVNPQKWLRR